MCFYCHDCLPVCLSVCPSVCLSVCPAGASSSEKGSQAVDIPKSSTHNHHGVDQERKREEEEEEDDQTHTSKVLTGRTEKDRSPLPPARLLPDPSCIYCNPCRPRVTSMDGLVEEEGEETRALLQILDFPSRVFATRQPVDLNTSYPKSKRIVLRDVLRTDRNIHYFR